MESNIKSSFCLNKTKFLEFLQEALPSRNEVKKFTGKPTTRSNEFSDRTFNCLHVSWWYDCLNWHSWWKGKSKPWLEQNHELGERLSI